MHTYFLVNPGFRISRFINNRIRVLFLAQALRQEKSSQEYYVLKCHVLNIISPSVSLSNHTQLSWLYLWSGFG